MYISCFEINKKIMTASSSNFRVYILFKYRNIVNIIIIYHNDKNLSD